MLPCLSTSPSARSLIIILSLLLFVLIPALMPAHADPASAPVHKSEAVSEAAAQAQPVILVLGDSLSAGYGLDAQTGWVALLQKRLTDGGYAYRVANASVSGDTTSGGLARLPAALDRHHPAIVLIELGGNDGLRALPLTTLRDNLGRLVDLSLAAKARVLLLEMQIPSNYGPAYTDGFTQSFGAVAASRKITRVPFFLASLIGVPGAFQDDGIHPVAASQPKMVDAVWPSLLPLLKAH